MEVSVLHNNKTVDAVVVTDLSKYSQAVLSLAEILLESQNLCCTIRFLDFNKGNCSPIYDRNYSIICITYLNFC